MLGFTAKKIKFSIIFPQLNQAINRYQSKNFRPSIVPSQSPKLVGSCNPTKLSSSPNLVDASGPMYLTLPITTRPDFAMTLAKCPNFRHFGDFGKNGNDCFDGLKSEIDSVYCHFVITVIFVVYVTSLYIILRTSAIDLSRFSIHFKVRHTINRFM